MLEIVMHDRNLDGKTETKFRYRVGHVFFYVLWFRGGPRSKFWSNDRGKFGSLEVVQRGFDMAEKIKKAREQNMGIDDL
jgi:hypothetical protein